MSGLEGTPGRQTLEWQWITGIRDSSGTLLPSVIGPVPTAYSGTAGTSPTVVSLTESFRPQGTGLNLVGTRTSERLENARAKLHFTLEEDISEDCKKNVLDKLPGLNVRSFLTYLNRGANFYDAETSAATVAGNAGTLAWANASYGQGATFSGVFGKNPGTMALSSMVNNTFTVFLREKYVNGMDANQLAAFLFHEALHGYGQGSGMFDQDLKDAFGISQSDPSSKISDYIQKHCFTKKKK